MNTSWIIGVQHVWFGISIFLLLLLLVSRTLFFREAILPSSSAGGTSFSSS